MSVLDRLDSLRRIDLSDKLVLTYDNTKKTDGVGAQLQRIFAIYAISRLLNVPYLHTPLAHVHYQGLRALEANVGRRDFHIEFNTLFHIESDVKTADGLYVIDLPHISLELLHHLAAGFQAGKSGGRRILTKVVLPYAIADRFPDCYQVCKQISPFASSARDALRVAIHVRRGELFVVDSDRMLPNRYYVNTAQNVANTLEALDVGYQIEVHTEVPNKEFIVRPDHHGITNRIRTPVVVNPSMCRLEEFQVLPNLVYCINESTIDCLRKLATADILIMSRSSFSYVAAILNKRCVALYHPFWHSALSSWMAVDSEGRFSDAEFKKAIKMLP